MSIELRTADPTTLPMWLMMPAGFFSIVRKRGETDLTVRSRVRGDLEALEKEYLPSLGPIIGGAGPITLIARVDAKALVAAIAGIVDDIDYRNFKDEVAARQGPGRAHVHGEIWSTLRKLTPKSQP